MGVSPNRGHQAVVILSTACVLLAVLLADAHRSQDSAEGSRDRAAESLQVAQSTKGSSGVWDSHPDADVARVLMPSLVDARQLGYRETPIDSNRFGMRERNYDVPKKPASLRIVLLGDSYVFGQGVLAEQRLGVHLERELRERAGARAQQIEVLHIGAASWNLVTECAFLRRQLTLLDPDVVIHISVPNDVDDTMGVRGMGLMARNVPRRPAQTDTVVRQLFAHWELHKGAFGHLALGLDHESRSRLDEVGFEIARLAELVEQQGGRYVHVFHWRVLNPVANLHLASRLQAEQAAWLPTSFYFDERIRLADGDDHWSPEGHQVMARYCFGLIDDRQLLPQAKLAPWKDATWALHGLNDDARAAALDPEALRLQQQKPRIVSRFDLGALSKSSAAQVHAGVSAEGFVAPYASLLLARDGGDELQVHGSFLDRPELVGGRVRVSVEGHVVAEFPLQASGPLVRSWPLPSELLEREILSVCFESDDWVYSLPTLRECHSFRIESVAIGNSSR